MIANYPCSEPLLEPHRNTLDRQDARSETAPRKMVERSLHQLRRGALTYFAFASLALSACGAKTALWVPCEIEVLPSTPQVVLIVDRSSGEGAGCGTMIVERGRHDIACIGRVTDMLGEVLPALNAHAAVGLYVFPEIGRIAIERDGLCTTPSDLIVPVADSGVSAVLGQLRQGDDGTHTYWDDLDLWPTGGAPLFAALQVVQHRLEAVPARGPRFIILTTTNVTNCNEDIAPSECVCFTADYGGGGSRDCLSQNVAGFNTCADSARVVEMIARMAENGIRTLVIAEDHPGLLAGSVGDQFRVAAAQAGGLQNAGPHPWYSVLDAPGITQAVSQRIAPAGWCEPHAARVPIDPENWSLHSRSRGPLSRDPSHRDGWDWVDPSSGTLRIYGNACDATLRDPGGLTISSMRQRCLE